MKEIKNFFKKLPKNENFILEFPTEINIMSGLNILGEPIATLDLSFNTKMIIITHYNLEKNDFLEYSNEINKKLLELPEVVSFNCDINSQRMVSIDYEIELDRRRDKDFNYEDEC